VEPEHGSPFQVGQDASVPALIRDYEQKLKIGERLETLFIQGFIITGLVALERDAVTDLVTCDFEDYDYVGDGRLVN
jgi:hypothetical protein